LRTALIVLYRAGDYHPFTANRSIRDLAARPSLTGSVVRALAFCETAG
jgi:hypothetical protein